MAKKTRFLLINPWIHDFAAYDFWAKPLGLLYLASVLREMGYLVDFIDCLAIYHPLIENDPLIPTPRRNPFGHGKFHCQIIPKPGILQDIPRHYRRYGIPPELFHQDLSKIEKPKAILMTSSMTYWYPGVHEAIALCKEAFPDVPLALGGIYATLSQAHAIEYSRADKLIRGADFQQVLSWASYLAGKSPIRSLKYLTLDELPYPAFDLLCKPDYVAIMTSRGCPYQCSYCGSNLLYCGYERRDPTKIAQEIDHWYWTMGIRDFAFYDDALLVDPEINLIPLLKEIAIRGLSCRFHTPNGIHVRGLTKRVAEWMIRSGFITVRLGFETSQPKWQFETGGKVNNKEFQEALSNLHQVGYSWSEIGVYIMVGLPGQKRKEVEESLRFVLDCGARPFLAEYSPIPGTKLWDRAVQSSPFPLEKEPLFHNNTLLPCLSDDLAYQDLMDLKSLLREMTSSLHKEEEENIPI